MLNMMNAGHAMLSKWGLSHIALDREDDVLDVGCGGGANISALLTMFGLFERECRKGDIRKQCGSSFRQMQHSAGRCAGNAV